VYRIVRFAAGEKPVDDLIGRTIPPTAMNLRNRAHSHRTCALLVRRRGTTSNFIPPARKRSRASGTSFRAASLQPQPDSPRQEKHRRRSQFNHSRAIEFLAHLSGQRIPLDLHRSSSREIVSQDQVSPTLLKSGRRRFAGRDLPLSGIRELLVLFQAQKENQHLPAQCLGWPKIVRSENTIFFYRQSLEGGFNILG